MYRIWTSMKYMKLPLPGKEFGPPSMNRLGKPGTVTPR